EYMRKLSVDELLSRARSFLAKRGYNLEHHSPSWLHSVLKMEQERSKTLKQLAENVGLFFSAPKQLDPKAVEKVLKKNDGLALLKEMRTVLAGLEEWWGWVLDTAVKGCAESHCRKRGDVAQPLRVALSGPTVSPPIHDTLHLLGQAESL